MKGSPEQTWRGLPYIPSWSVGLGAGWASPDPVGSEGFIDLRFEHSHRPHIHRGPIVDLILCCCHLDILNNFLNKGPGIFILYWGLQITIADISTWMRFFFYLLALKFYKVLCISCSVIWAVIILLNCVDNCLLHQWTVWLLPKSFGPRLMSTPAHT